MDCEYNSPILNAILHAVFKVLKREIDSELTKKNSRAADNLVFTRLIFMVSICFIGRSMKLRLMPLGHLPDQIEMYQLFYSIST